MSYDGSGNFRRLFSWLNDAANNVNIRADRMDQEMDGFAAGLSNAITRDGQGKPSSAIDWNGQNLSNVNTLGANAVTIATTPAQFDNTSKAAPTSFVQRALGNLSGIASISADATLTAANAGQATLLGGSTNYTVTLPAANAVAAGAVFRFMNYGTGRPQVTCYGADQISVSSATAGAMPIGPGESLSLVSNGGTGWFAIDGSAQLKNAAGFGAALSASGYQKLPSGLILQWGSVSCANAQTTNATFPIAFPTATLQVVCSGNVAAGGVQAYVTVNDASTTAVNFNAFTAASGSAPALAPAGSVIIKFYAIGY